MKLKIKYNTQSGEILGKGAFTHQYRNIGENEDVIDIDFPNDLVSEKKANLIVNLADKTIRKKTNNELVAVTKKQKIKNEINSILGSDLSKIVTDDLSVRTELEELKAEIQMAGTINQIIQLIEDFRTSFKEI